MFVFKFVYPLNLHFFNFFGTIDVLYKYSYITIFLLFFYYFFVLTKKKLGMISL